ncbi:hypothetical protein LTR22_027109 [Elasticomyces elasticus]|nr:hypothetical protein LTR22_027109 [Elasticomyces elasticus]
MGLVEGFYDPTINRPYDESKPSHTTYTTVVENWSDDELEDNHEYIQWLFPIPECSRRQHEEAPPLDPETRDAFHARQELRDRMHRAWKRMMAFYGLECGQCLGYRERSSCPVSWERVVTTEMLTVLGSQGSIT